MHILDATAPTSTDAVAITLGCCAHSLTVVELLRRGQWASNARQWEVAIWCYFRCPGCNDACWFGHRDHDGLGLMGIFGASPVADLIPLKDLPELPAPQIGPKGLIYSAGKERIVVPGDVRFWRTGQTGGAEPAR